MRDFCNKIGRRFAGVPPSPWGEWWGLARRGVSPFDPAFAAVSPMMVRHAPELPQLLGEAPGAPSYLPIEALRDRELGERLFAGRRVEQTFRSSGTTQSSRSLSRFSPEGLECYRQQSLYVFFDVLTQVLGRDPQGLRGLSLIPPPSAWPDSSLARMVAWIAELVPVTYVSRDDLATVLKAGSSQEPVWIFGTAFHWVDLLDQGPWPKLPPGSVAIETGGTKGRTRSVTRDELYALIADGLGIGTEKIISEYGMCELAAQAYDFAAVDGERRFRFPAWVRTQVLTAPGLASPEGQGILLVEDPLRVDHPWPLRTEDLADLGPRGFTLLGRVEQAPLKGCSLRAEEEAGFGSDHAATEMEPGAMTPPPADGPGHAPGACPEPAIPVTSWPLAGPEAMAARAQAIDRLLRSLAATEASSLTKELGSRPAAEQALRDLEASLPPDEAAWVQAAWTARGENPAGRWLLILPESHSFVGLYPVALGYVLGLAMTVRVPGGFAKAESFLTRFLTSVQRLDGAQLSLAGPDLRVGAVDLTPFDAVLAYGEDQTIAALQRLSSRPVHGFGGRWALSLVAAEDLAHQGPAIIRDALALGQRGCMATRLVMVHDPRGELLPLEVGEGLAARGRDYWGEPLPWRERAAKDLEGWRLSRLGFAIQPGEEAAPLVAVRALSLSHLTMALVQEGVSRRPFVLPVLLLRGDSPAAFLQAAWANLGATGTLASCSLSSSLAGLIHGAGGAPSAPMPSWLFRDLGSANAPSWNGLHEGRPLFADSVI